MYCWRPSSLSSNRVITVVRSSAVRGDRTLAELAEHFDVHPNQIQDWEEEAGG